DVCSSELQRRLFMHRDHSWRSLLDRRRSRAGPDAIPSSPGKRSLYEIGGEPATHAIAKRVLLPGTCAIVETFNILVIGPPLAAHLYFEARHMRLARADRKSVVYGKTE